MTAKSFDVLWEELNEIAQTRPVGSSTVTELDSGVHSIGKKIVEEAAEVWMAAEYEDRASLALEISQLLYHIQVLMIACGLSINEINEKL
jgi:phosphoribosyl-ATP pyrophosphohydrolase